MDYIKWKLEQNKDNEWDYDGSEASDEAAALDFAEVLDGTPISDDSDYFIELLDPINRMDYQYSGQLDDAHEQYDLLGDGNE